MKEFSSHYDQRQFFLTATIMKNVRSTYDYKKVSLTATIRKELHMPT